MVSILPSTDERLPRITGTLLNMSALVQESLDAQHQLMELTQVKREKEKERERKIKRKRKRKDKEKKKERNDIVADIFL